MDEKGIQLCRHKAPKVLARKGARRVHSRGKEHGENVTVVAAANALGTVIPPLILFKGKRKQPEWKDALPRGCDVEMTPKGSMMAETFVKYLSHFAKFKPEGKCLLLLDGAKCHFDLQIAEQASALDIELLCLPSNTTHELQPLDKSVFRSLEYMWDDEVDLFWELTETRLFGKLDFCKVFSRAWARDNVMSGFEACGVYPFNPGRIAVEAFAPSDVSEPVSPSATKLTPVTPTSSRIQMPVSNSTISTSPAGDICSQMVAENHSIAKFKKFLSSTIQPTERTQSRKALNSKAVRIQRKLFIGNNSLESQYVNDEDIDDENLEPEPKLNLSSAIKKNDFVVVFIIFDFGTKKELKKFYVGRVLNVGVGRKKSQVEVDCLRRILQLTTEAYDTGGLVGFSQPRLRDVWKIDPVQVLQTLEAKYERRG